MKFLVIILTHVVLFFSTLYNIWIVVLYAGLWANLYARIRKHSTASHQNYSLREMPRAYTFIMEHNWFITRILRDSCIANTTATKVRYYWPPAPGVLMTITNWTLVDKNWRLLKVPTVPPIATTESTGISIRSPLRLQNTRQSQRRLKFSSVNLKGSPVSCLPS